MSAIDRGFLVTANAIDSEQKSEVFVPSDDREVFWAEIARLAEAGLRVEIVPISPEDKYAVWISPGDIPDVFVWLRPDKDSG